MDNVMLDLETMGTGPSSAIVAIGAVRFDPVAGKLGDEFYRVVDLQSAVDDGGVIDPSTVLWWMKQSDEARREFERVGFPIRNALLDFAMFIQPDDKVWGNGASFDNVILRSAYEHAGQPCPWKWYNDRCYRTVKSTSDLKIVNSGVKHNALSDSIAQANHLIEIYASLK